MTPISDELLSKPANSYVAVRGDRTLLEALYALQAEDGREWWFLIVELGERRYLAARFGAFRERLAAQGEALLALPLRDVGDPLVPVEVVDRGVDLSLAERRAERSPAGLVIVLEAGGPPAGIAGVLSVGGTRDAPSFDGPSLLALAGLPDTGFGGAVEEAAPEAPAAAEPGRSTTKRREEADRIAVGIGGSVESGGQVIVAGDDVNIYTAPPDEETRVQFRRFEAAFPQEVHLGVEEKLFVAVLLPDRPSPFTGVIRPQSTGSTDEVPIPTPVDARTGRLKPVDIEVSITTTGFKVKGDTVKSLTVWPDGRTAMRWFLLEPEEAGRQQIMIELVYNQRLLDEITLEAEVFRPEARARRLLNLSLSVVAFNLQFSFGLGPAAA
jgi:hypothetical protein